MSKSTTNPWDFSDPVSDPVPSYEESIVARPALQPTSREKSGAGPSIIRQERTRRIANLVANSIIPCFTQYLSNAYNKLTIAVVPSDCLRTSGEVTGQNIVAPPLTSETTTSVIVLSGDDNRSSFWTQRAVVYELDQILRQQLWLLTGTDGIPPELARSRINDLIPHIRSETQHDTVELPPRMNKKSWLKRAFVLPGPDHDPTGETGKWKLGWREETDPSATQAASFGEIPARTRTRPLGADEIDVNTILRDVSFRTESELGLLETTTVKCIWVEIEVGV
ncbi:hypothetical protein ABEF95_016079 [Exophiala dermatitidis]